MPGFTYEDCRAKIAEIERRIAAGLAPEALADYSLMLACWRWLAERAVDRPQEPCAAVQGS